MSLLLRHVPQTALWSSGLHPSLASSVASLVSLKETVAVVTAALAEVSKGQLIPALGVEDPGCRLTVD